MKEKDRKILDESKEIFEYLSDSKLRKTWIENDKINCNYYYNKQWNNVKAWQGLIDIGCEPITDNRIKTIIDRYSSILIKSGKRVGFMPTTKSQYHANLSNYIKNWAFNVQSHNNHNFFSDLKCKSALFSGIGWSHFYYENNRFYYEWVNPREMYFDPDDLSPRLENQNVIARSYFVNVVRLKNLFPKYSSIFDDMVENNKGNRNLDVEDFNDFDSSVWVNGKSIRIVELYSKKSDKYFEATCDIKNNSNNERQIDQRYQEFDETIFTTFNEELINQKATGEVETKTGTKIYKTVFCQDVLIYHGPVAEQVPNQVFFPYVPMVYARNMNGEFLGIINYMIDLQDLWNVELSKMFHYSNSKLTIANPAGSSMNYEELRKSFEIESKKKRGFIIADPKNITTVDNSNDLKGILNSLDMLNREFQNLSGLFDDFAGKPTNAESGVAIQSRVSSTLNAQNSLVLAYEYMLTSEGRLMLDTLKGIENFKQVITFYNEGKQDTAVLDSDISLLNFEVYPTTTPNFSSNIEEEKEIFNSIIKSGLADLLLSSPIFLQQGGMSEMTSYKLSEEYKRIVLEKMQLQQGVIPNQQKEDEQ
jgi:hypothetical protein